MRTQSSLKNLTFAFGGQSVGLVISFITRIIFVRILSAEYLGLNGLFTNIISLLSLVDLGVGEALNYSLYKPLSDNDMEKVKSLMRLYQRAYRVIGIIVAVIGFSLTPFLSFFIKNIPNIPHIKFIYLLFVFNSVVSYFYSYKRSLIISDQKRYIATIYRYGFFIAMNIVQIIVLIVTHNYVLFLVCQIAATLLENIVVSKKTDTLYPYLKEKRINQLDKETIQQIIKNTKALIVHRLGGVVVNSTDNLVISRYVGMVWVGFYSNYQLVINALNLIISHVFASITASVGNLGVSESQEKIKSIFNIVFFVNFWIYSFFTICLVSVFTPFIKIWVGEEYILSTNTVLIIILNFYLSGMRRTVLTFRDAMGLYWYDRYKPIFEIIINLTASLVLVKKLGVTGVFLGTTTSIITTNLWVEPYILHKYGLKTSVIPFFKRYMFYTIVTIFSCFATYSIANIFQGNSVLTLCIRIMFCILVPNIIFLLIFYRTSEFNYLREMIGKTILGKFKALKFRA